MMAFINTKVYAEVFEVIKSNKEFRENIPTDVIRYFQKKCSRNWL